MNEKHGHAAPHVVVGNLDPVGKGDHGPKMTLPLSDLLDFPAPEAAFPSGRL